MLGDAAIRNDVATLPIGRRDLFHAILLQLGGLAVVLHVAIRGIALAFFAVSGMVGGDWGTFRAIVYPYSQMFAAVGAAPEGPTLILLAAINHLSGLTGALVGIVVPAAFIAWPRSREAGVAAAFAVSFAINIVSKIAESVAIFAFTRFLGRLSDEGIFIDAMSLAALASDAVMLFAFYGLCRARFERGPLASEGSA